MKELIEIQSRLKAPKSNKNTFGNYKYRSCEDILEAVKPLCTELGVLLTLSDEIIQLGERYYIKATATISKGANELIEVTAYARESLTKKGMDDSQITGTASSYARKYALNGLFCIDDTKDADTDEHANTIKANEPKPTTLTKEQFNQLLLIGNQKGFDAKSIEGSLIKNFKHGMEQLTQAEYDKSMKQLKALPDKK